MSVVIETTAGDFTVDLFVEQRPHACKNFLKLCKIKYYNFCLFHSIQHNFIAQTGDPTGSGKNGASVYSKIFGDERKFFEAEMIPKMKHSKAGLLSMVNCGDNMLGSQFFLTLSNELQSLDGEHCVFGEIAEGSEILLKLNEVICDNEHRPYQDIRITHTVILEDPFDDPPGLIVPDGSPEPSKETLLNGRIAADEDLDESKGLTPQELEEMVRQREAQAQATILEIVGDLPDADMAPPENVLFVCKLNPVTSDDDLEIIFSRFGKVKSCEVIRDKSTGDSLQYAFVEFEEQKSCEDAFFKMDNVLIDDRRIHVDFSQSVSKMRWKGKGRGVEHFKEDKALNNNKSSHRNTERMPPPKDKSRKEDDNRANGHPDSHSKSRKEPREQQGRDPDRDKFRSDENNSRRERHDDRPNLKDRSERHHRSNHDERESDSFNERSRRHHHDGLDDRNRGEKRPGREERILERDPHRHDGNRRRERVEDRSEIRERSRHDERSREERRERPQREDRHREERCGVERSHRDDRGREERDRFHRDDRLGGVKHSLREEEREELRYPESKGRGRDVSRLDNKHSQGEYDNRHLKEETASRSKGRDSNKRPLEKETEKKSLKVVSKTKEKAKDGSKQKSVSKKRRSSSSSSSSSTSSSSSSSGNSSSSESSDASVKRRKTKSKKESARKKAKMAKKSRTKSKSDKVKAK